MNFAPVNPNAGSEAKSLLAFLQDVSGKSILSGQHNNPGSISTHSEQVRQLCEKYPAVWGQDFGFSEDAWDGVQFRDAVIAEAIRQHRKGSIITLMWHAVRPTDREPGTFKDNVQGNLSESDWNALLTPGSDVHANWLRQVDIVAKLLITLRDEKIPVLWRPYHEMNGGWFWWGHRRGENGYAKLWRMMFDLLTNKYQLNNLLWVWNANAPNSNAGAYAEYFPGVDVVDCLATDIYSRDYKQSHHDELVKLGKGKPIAIGECGGFPTIEQLRAQPNYTWFMSWGNLFWRQNTKEEIEAIMGDSRTLHRPAMPR